MNILTTIGTAIAGIFNVVIKLCSAAERGANSLDQLAKAGEAKATNYTNLVMLNDEEKYNERLAEINAKRKAAGLEVKQIESVQAKAEREQSAAAKAATEALV
ncbi:hypothetical protein [Acinetobacter sp. A47]|uniref:hypothetical protein n=1 Tax=Acinetobacter sp. A47 TaxID=1561217 RepID=UPI00057118E2|nr:hypothetical protein [Acinetobacter sp. A47]